MVVEVTEYNFKFDITEWARVSVKEEWPRGVQDYGDVPFLVHLNDLFIDLSNEIDEDDVKIISNIMVDMFHLLCMRNPVKTFKMLAIMQNSIEKDVKLAVLKELRDALVNSLAEEENEDATSS